MSVRQHVYHWQLIKLPYWHIVQMVIILQVTQIFEAGKEFFQLPTENKQKYERGKLTQNHGWLQIEGEK